MDDNACCSDSHQSLSSDIQEVPVTNTWRPTPAVIKTITPITSSPAMPVHKTITIIPKVIRTEQKDPKK